MTSRATEPAAVAVSNPTHETGGPHTAWSTVNTAENFPGVATPLGWTFWRDPLELALRGAFADLGVLRKSDIRVADCVDDRFTTAIFGRFAGNVDQMRLISDRMPGASGSETERQIFGSARPEVRDNRQRARYPIIALKMPRHVWRLPAALRRWRRETDAWWRTNTRPGALPDERAARAALAESIARFEQVIRAHMVVSMVGTAIYAQLTTLAEASGNPGLETTLASGYGGMEETESVNELWRVARGELTLEQFIDRHGYHGPAESELASVTWREDPSPVQSLVQAYARKHDSWSPQRSHQRQRSARIEAESRVLGGLPAYKRPIARTLFTIAACYIPLREVGKAAFLQNIDVGRAAARTLGRILHERGLLDSADDVFYLTADELLHILPGDTAGTISQRKHIHRHYNNFQLPDRWTGVPEPVGAPSPTSTSHTLIGIAVSPGQVEGRARVMVEPDSADLEDDEILVCNTTDPSWASLFVLASAVVIDIGATMSHGAIVAREMGIPCVINTRVGTTLIKTGDRILVDGTTGTVHLIDGSSDTDVSDLSHTGG
jgi:pyruvate,water dikinase